MAFYVEGNGEYKKIKWSDVKRVSISIPNSKDFDCLYSSEYSPWMYECSVKLKSTVTTKDGKSYQADSGHKWKFVTDDDAEHGPREPQLEDDELIEVTPSALRLRKRELDPNARRKSQRTLASRNS